MPTKTKVDTAADAFHFRNRDGAEVDLVLEAYDGRVVGIEMKVAKAVNTADFRFLRFLRDRIGSAFVAGVLLYTGEHPLSFGDRLTAVPASVLWGSQPIPDMQSSRPPLR